VCVCVFVMYKYKLSQDTIIESYFDEGGTKSSNSKADHASTGGPFNIFIEYLIYLTLNFASCIARYDSLLEVNDLR